jgi:uncharacterized protein (TIGR02231 family)
MPAGRGLNANDLHQTLDIIERDYAATARAIVAKQADLAPLKAAADKAAAAVKAASQMLRELYEARIAITASEAGPVAIDLTYRVPDASWAALYDLRLDSTANLAITLDGAVTQDSGEDWNAIALTLTTGRSADIGAHDTLPPDRAGLVKPQAEVSPVAAMHMMAPPPPMAAPASAVKTARYDDAPPPPMVTRKLATIQSGDFTAEFKVNGAADVASGTVEKRLPLTITEVKATLELVAVPELDAHPSLRASFTNSAQAPMLQGKSNLYRDGTFIGTQSMPGLAPGEKIALAFGSDEKISLKRRIKLNERGEEGGFSSDLTLTRSWTETLHNFHDHAVIVSVIDRIPSSDDDKLVIEPLGAAIKPSRKDVNGPGVFATELEIPAGGEKSYDFGFKAHWPKDSRPLGLN